MSVMLGNGVPVLGRVNPGHLLLARHGREGDTTILVIIASPINMLESMAFRSSWVASCFAPFRPAGSLGRKRRSSRRPLLTSMPGDFVLQNIACFRDPSIVRGVARIVDGPIHRKHSIPGITFRGMGWSSSRPPLSLSGPPDVVCDDMRGLGRHPCRAPPPPRGDRGPQRRERRNVSPRAEDLLEGGVDAVDGDRVDAGERLDNIGKDPRLLCPGTAARPVQAEAEASAELEVDHPLQI